jgi:hypothetical protein
MYKFNDVPLFYEVPGGYAFRKGVTFYNADFDPKKSDIDIENTYKWIPF